MWPFNSRTAAVAASDSLKSPDCIAWPRYLVVSVKHEPFWAGAWPLHPEEMQIALEIESCDCWSYAKRPRYYRGTPSSALILLPIIWRTSPVEVSPACVSDQMAFAEIRRVRGDVWTSFLICRTYHSQFVFIRNWYAMVIGDSLLQMHRYTFPSFEEAMNSFLSPRWAYYSQLKISMRYCC